MEKPPMDWIDKLFDCMHQFYGKRWDKQFDRFMPIALLKTIWQSSLQGCTYDEIRHTLLLQKRASINPWGIPPNHLEFYRLAKRETCDNILSNNKPNPNNPIVAKAALDEIRANLKRAG
jgi:hypothetical protein